MHGNIMAPLCSNSYRRSMTQAAFSSVGSLALCRWKIFRSRTAGAQQSPNSKVREAGPESADRRALVRAQTEVGSKRQGGGRVSGVQFATNDFVTDRGPAQLAAQLN